MPKYGKRSEVDETRIQEAVTRLRSYSGFVDTPRLSKAIEQWVEEKRVEVAKDIDRVKDVYRKRAAVIGFTMEQRRVGGKDWSDAMEKGGAGEKWQNDKMTIRNRRHVLICSEWLT